MTMFCAATLPNETAEAVHLADDRGPKPLPPADGRTADVIACDGLEAWISCDGATHRGRVAFGCLVRPEPGDRVLTCRADGAVWILSVLQRRSDAPRRLWVDGDLAVESAGGDISITGGTVDIGAAATVRATAPAIELHAGVARFVLNELVHVGQRINWYVTKLRSVGEVVETLAEHLLVRASRSTRIIAESDQVRAGDIDHRAEGTLQLQADIALVSAGQLVRVDADQIHMG